MSASTSTGAPTAKKVKTEGSPPSSLDERLRAITRPTSAFQILNELQREQIVTDLALLSDIRAMFAALQSELDDATRFNEVIREPPPLRIAELERLRANILRARAEVLDFVARRRAIAPGVIDYGNWAATELANNIATNVDAQISDLVGALADEQRAPIEQQQKLERTAELRRLTADALAAEATLREVVASIATLAKKTADADRDVEAWKRRVDEAQSVIKTLNEPIDDLRVTENGVERSVTLAGFLKYYGSLQTQLTARAADLQRVVAELRRLTSSSTKLQAELTTAYEFLKQYDDAKLAAMKQQLDTDKAKIDQLAAQSAANAASVAELERSVTRNAKLTADVDASVARIRASLEQYDAAWLERQRAALAASADPLQKLSVDAARLDLQASAYASDAKSAQATLLRTSASLGKLRTQIALTREEVALEARRLQADLVATDELQSAVDEYRLKFDEAARQTPNLTPLQLAELASNSYLAELKKWDGNDNRVPYLYVLARTDLARRKLDAAKAPPAPAPAPVPTPIPAPEPEVKREELEEVPGLIRKFEPNLNSSTREALLNQLFDLLNRLLASGDLPRAQMIQLLRYLQDLPVRDDFKPFLKSSLDDLQATVLEKKDLSYAEQQFLERLRQEMFPAASTTATDQTSVFKKRRQGIASKITSTAMLHAFLALPSPTN